jgi:hypothetical protein
LPRPGGCPLPAPFAPGERYKLEADKGPQTLTAIPGTYTVDNLCNAGGGNEDYAFMLDDTGKVSGIESSYVISKEQTGKRNGDEYAEYKDNIVSPRMAIIHFKVEASGTVSIFGTHKLGKPAVTGTTYEIDMPATVGSAGLNIWSFGKWEVTGGDAVLPNGKPATGTLGENDYHFYPILRYNMEKKAFYFETLHGPDTTSIGEAKGFYDGNARELSVKVTATIVPEKPTEEKAKEPAK